MQFKTEKQFEIKPIHFKTEQPFIHPDLVSPLNSAKFPKTPKEFKSEKAKTGLLSKIAIGGGVFAVAAIAGLAVASGSLGMASLLIIPILLLPAVFDNSAAESRFKPKDGKSANKVEFLSMIGHLNRMATNQLTQSFLHPTKK